MKPQKGKQQEVAISHPKCQEKSLRTCPWLQHGAKKLLCPIGKSSCAAPYIGNLTHSLLKYGLWGM